MDRSNKRTITSLKTEKKEHNSYGSLQIDE